MSGRLLYLVDDEEAIRRSLCLMLQLAGHQVVVFASGTAFVAEVDGLAPGCILLDIRMPEMNGLEVQQELAQRDIDMPIVMMTGHGDIATAVAALQAGAEDFIEKPFERAKMLTAVEQACLRLSDPPAYHAIAADAGKRLETLTEAEAAVLDAFAEGLSNQAAAAMLGQDLATVETLRATLVEKLDVDGLSDAIRIVFLAKRSA